MTADTATDELGPWTALTAASARLTSETISRHVKKSRESDAGDTWEMYRLVGEHRFLTNAIANRASQVRFFVGRIDQGEDADAEPTPVEKGFSIGGQELGSVLGWLGTPPKVARLTRRWTLGLLNPGESWMAGIPPYMLDHGESEIDFTRPVSIITAAPSQALPVTGPVDADRIAPLPEGAPALFAPDGSPVDFSTLEWVALSNSEVLESTDDSVKLIVDGVKITARPDMLMLARMWNEDPERAERADSPTLSALPVLREIVGLRQHTSAQIDSRLSSAGWLFLAQAVVDAMRSGDSDLGDVNPMLEELIQVMSTALSDPSSAAAKVPGVSIVPFDNSDRPVSDYVHYQRFDAPLDTTAPGMLDQAIRSYALSMDAPPELLLGTSDSNHWNAWFSNEDVINSHLKPPATLIAEALTEQFLHPALIELGATEEQLAEFVIWFSVDHLLARTQNVADGVLLYDRSTISDDALRRVAGYTEEDAPAATNPRDEAVSRALTMVSQAPSLLQVMSLPDLVEQIHAAITGTEIPAPATPAPAPAEEVAPVPAPAEDAAPAESGPIPDTQEDTASPGSPTSEGPIA